MLKKKTVRNQYSIFHSYLHTYVLLNSRSMEAKSLRWPCQVRVFRPLWMALMPARILLRANHAVVRFSEMADSRLKFFGDMLIPKIIFLTVMPAGKSSNICLIDL